MQSFTFFLFYSDSPLFERSLLRLQFLCQSMLDRSEILVFYHRPLPLKELSQKYPHVRWRRVLTTSALKKQNSPKTFALLAQAMRVSRGDFFFYLDGAALYSHSDFMVLLNTLASAASIGNQTQNKKFEKNFERIQQVPLMPLVAYRRARRYLLFKQKFESNGLPKNIKKDKDEKLAKQNFFSKKLTRLKKFFVFFLHKGTAQLYTKIFTRGSQENYRIWACQKSSIKKFYISLERKAQFQLLRHELPADGKPPLSFLFFSEKQKHPLSFLDAGDAYSRFFFTKQTRLFAFYPLFLQTLSLTFTYKVFPAWIRASFFSVPLLHMTILFFLVFGFSSVVQILSSLIIFLFLLPFSFSAKFAQSTQHKGGSAKDTNFFLWPWQLIKNLVSVVFL